MENIEMKIIEWVLIVLGGCSLVVIFSSFWMTSKAFKTFQDCAKKGLLDYELEQKNPPKAKTPAELPEDTNQTGTPTKQRGGLR